MSVVKFAMTATALGLISSTLFGVASASPANASADSCYFVGWYWFGTNPSNSDVGYANPGCDGMYANGDINAPSHSDNVRGWYYKDGSWQKSSLGWKYVGPNTVPQKIVGNTTDNRALRGEAYTVGNSYRVWL